jgi:ABC-type phosphate transport system ATPase subunit
MNRKREKIITSGDKEFAEYLVKWIAWSIQNPDKQAEVALVLIGQKGCGKGTLGKCLKRTEVKFSKLGPRLRLAG